MKIKVLGRTNRAQWKSSRKNKLHREKIARVGRVGRLVPRTVLQWIGWLAALHFLFSCIYAGAWLFPGRDMLRGAGVFLNWTGAAISLLGLIRMVFLKRRRFTLDRIVWYFWIFAVLFFGFGLVSTGLSAEPVGFILSGICLLYYCLVLTGTRAGLRRG